MPPPARPSSSDWHRARRSTASRKIYLSRIVASSKTPSRSSRPELRLLSSIHHGPDQTQAPHQAPRDGGRDDPDTGSHGSPAVRRRKEESDPVGGARAPAELAAHVEGL